MGKSSAYGDVRNCCRLGLVVPEQGTRNLGEADGLTFPSFPSPQSPDIRGTLLPSSVARKPIFVSLGTIDDVVYNSPC
jgi:hypothetical protein